MAQDLETVAVRLLNENLALKREIEDLRETVTLMALDIEELRSEQGATCSNEWNEEPTF